MRIVFITTEFVSEEGSFDGGLANYLYKICLALKERNHEPIVILNSKKNNNSDETLFYNGIEVHRVSWKINLLYKALDKLSRFRWQPFFNTLWTSYYLNKYAKKINRKKKIDIIQIADMGALPFFRPSNIPSVVRASSILKLWNQASEKIPTRQDKSLEMISALNYKRSKAIYAPSHFLAGEIREMSNKKVSVIETLFLKKNLEENPLIVDAIHDTIGGAKYLLFYGRLGIWKGIVEIGNILFPLLEKNKDLFFVFIGKDKGVHNNESSVDFLKRKAKQFSNRVLHFKNVRHEKLIPVIKKAYAVILPSRIENLPNACIEAMGMGKVVLGTNRVSFEQLIVDGYSGFLFEPMNEEDLLKKIEQILNLEEHEKKEIEKKAAERIELHHPEKIVPQLVDYLKENIKVQSF
jgi:glycosyltransferase involved in cell wall biosynthesis